MGIGKAWYNSLQLVVQKRVSRGFTFTSAYTFSRTMEQDEFLNAQDAEPLTMIADQDRPHIWQFNGVYELPLGRGKTIGRNVGSAVNRIVGGWQFNWNFNWQSGRPLGMPGGVEPIPGTSAKLANPTPDRWFNTCYADLNGVLQKCQPGESPCGASGRRSRCGQRRCASTISASRGSRRWTPLCSSTSSCRAAPVWRSG